MMNYPERQIARRESAMRSPKLILLSMTSFELRLLDSYQLLRGMKLTAHTVSISIPAIGFC